MFHDASSTAQVGAGPGRLGGILRRAQVACDDMRAIDILRDDLGGDLALVVLFVSPDVGFQDVLTQAQTAFGDVPVVGCTTAGEIGAQGYETGQIVAIGLPSAQFAADCIAVDDLDQMQAEQMAEQMVDEVIRRRLKLTDAHPDLTDGFALLLIDGLSLKEDAVTAALALALRDMPLFGGSAGDGTRFRATQVGHNGRAMGNAAVVCLIRTTCRVKVFSLDHLIPSDVSMVVTGADPERRVVKTINAEPAAREYARIVGKDPEQLDELAFAAHPIVVRIGGDHHVRAIQRVNRAGELVFFSAIDEGMVLTVAHGSEMATHLDRKLAALGEGSAQSDIIGCDCVLRRLEAEQMQQTRAVSDVLAKHRVIGFSTYGEQIGPLHVNHTMTGVALLAHLDR